MRSTITAFLTVTVVAFAVFIGNSSYAADVDDLCSWISKDVVIALVIREPRQLIEEWKKSSLRQGLQQHPLFQQALKNPGMQQAETVVNLLELQTKHDRYELLGKTLGRGMVVALLPQNRVVAIVQAEDAEVLQQVHEFFLGLAKLDAANKNHPERVRSAEYRGVTGWTFGGDEFHAIIGNRLILSNQAEAIKEIVDLSLDQPAETLKSNPKFVSASQAIQEKNVTLFLDLDVIRQLANFPKGLEHSKQPLPGLLLAGVVAALEKASWLALGINIENDRLNGTLRLGEVSDWPKALSFAVAPPEEGILPPLEVPNLLASMSFYRNLRDFYAQKNELFPERTSGLIFFENMMGIFFTGRNFTEEVLGELEPHFRVVVAAQRFAPEVGTPIVQLPAMALVFRMKNPEKFAPVVEEGFQKALGLINFVRGQDAQPGLILDRPEYRGVKYTLAYFSPTNEPDRSRLDIRFNFSPVLACRGRDVVLSTAEPLAKDILDALAKEEEAATGVVKSITARVQVVGDQIARLLQLNLEALIAQNMAEKGHGRQEAEAEITRLIQILHLLNRLEISESLLPGQAKIDLGLDWHWPTTETTQP
ncbi:MAG: hypothetical protein ACUVTH_03055 [Thermogutta sp.]